MASKRIKQKNQCKSDYKFDIKAKYLRLTTSNKCAALFNLKENTKNHSNKTEIKLKKTNNKTKYLRKNVTKSLFPRKQENRFIDWNMRHLQKK